ncbi:hypothetical protein D3P09_06475 [Paenibacillus pinisoli]|uniref:Uncharacterized protein n=1 Tax=Paenibacillus pinisoli TaxID=1276110 RepID=A0A3A6Q6Y5_9BACL|nr:hypothetical protein [Paenibacillus pinisoli]RJX41604.1 hypothetical protein D3P09_06475 [Paenibacillus pinisoli]
MSEWTLYAIRTGLIVLTASFQIYMAVSLYRLEKSVLWALIGLLLPFGLNVLLYQAVKLEPASRYDLGKLPADRRKLWRRTHLLLLLQYMILFGVVGWFLSPA